jgi:hypothetical protein
MPVIGETLDAIPAIEAGNIFRPPDGYVRFTGVIGIFEGDPVDRNYQEYMPAAVLQILDQVDALALGQVLDDVGGDDDIGRQRRISPDELRGILIDDFIVDGIADRTAVSPARCRPRHMFCEWAALESPRYREASCRTSPFQARSPGLYPDHKAGLFPWQCCRIRSLKMA